MLPSYVEPMLAMMGEPFDSPDYIYEIKWDGYRCIAFLDNGTRLQSRNQKDLTMVFPELSQIHRHFPKPGVIIDGEIIALRDGKPSFLELQKRGQLRNQENIKLAAKKTPVLFIAFDLLYFNFQSICKKELSFRRELLLNSCSDKNELIISRFIEKDGVDYFRAISQMGMEGVIAKKKDSLYLPGKRIKSWVKFKRKLKENFIICGFTLNPTSRGELSSLILGAYHEDKLKFFGMVGIGFTRQELLIFKEELKKIQTEICPFTGGPLKQEKTVWTKPIIVCEVEYLELTDEGSLRHPIFKRVRADLTPEDCIYGDDKDAEHHHN